VLGVLTIERMALEDVDWSGLDAFHDRVVFQTREWLEFVASTQGAEPVVAAVLADGEIVGYFTGLIVRRFGVRILGSPFPGWTTLSMGFNLRAGVSRRAATEALVRFAFGPLRCLHVELKDRELSVEDLAGLDFEHKPMVTFEVDLTSSEDQIFGRMTSACRRAVRKAEKSGVTIEEASGEDFADEYHAQLVEVFERQGLTPTYDAERVRTMIRTVHPTGNLLLLRAIGPDGERVATGIFPGLNRAGYFWGGASRKEGQILRPNEAIFWYAMRYWRERGAEVLDMGGGGDYKRKYGPAELSVPWFRRSRVAALGKARDVAAAVINRRLGQG
jgi:CelD/BcsL family acetyltransferase involved in cellulose biosynthesis